jgi:hypothetical protein
MDNQLRCHPPDLTKLDRDNARVHSPIVAAKKSPAHGGSWLHKGEMHNIPPDTASLTRGRTIVGDKVFARFNARADAGGDPADETTRLPLDSSAGVDICRCNANARHGGSRSEQRKLITQPLSAVRATSSWMLQGRHRLYATSPTCDRHSRISRTIRS